MAQQIDRRTFLSLGTAAAVCNVIPIARRAAAADSALTTTVSNQRYKIAACDWMLLKRQTLGALQLAKDCGMDGLEVDTGSLGETGEKAKNDLLKDDFRQSYLDASKKLGIEICSLAMSAFYAWSWVDHPKMEPYTNDWIELMPKLGVKVGFLPLGVGCDLKKHPEVRPKVVERLKQFAPKAEKAGVIIGIETTLNAEDSLRLLDDVGSPAVQIYYNPENSLDQGYDLYKELRLLGPKHICQFHFSDRDGVRLGEPECRLDVPKCKAVLDEIGWRGWLVIERSRKPPTRDVKGNFSANAKYLKSIFQPT